MQVVIMETITDLFKQLGGGVKVNLSGSHIHMPHIGCQGREPGVDILTIPRSEEHTSELQSHSFISYAVCCLKKKKIRDATTSPPK